MAVRFDAANEYYSATLSLGAQANLTITCWAKINVDRNQFSTFWNIDNTGQSASIRGLQTPVGGINAEPYTASGAMTGTDVTMPLNTWLFLGALLTGNNATVRHRTAGSATWTTRTFTGASDALTANRLVLGESAWTGEWLNGCLAAVKIWTGNHSLAELEAEAPYYNPVKTAGLVAYYPFDTGPSTTDASGNGYTLTGGSGAANESSPADLSWLVTAVPFQGWGVPV